MDCNISFGDVSLNIIIIVSAGQYRKYISFVTQAYYGLHTFFASFKQTRHC